MLIFYKEDFQFSLSGVSTKILFSEIGNGWEPAVLDTQEEYDFIKEGQRSFSSSVEYWIGGSTNATQFFTYSDYVTNDSGNYHYDMFKFNVFN